MSRLAAAPRVAVLLLLVVVGIALLMILPAGSFLAGASAAPVSTASTPLSNSASASTSTHSLSEVTAQQNQRNLASFAQNIPSNLQHVPWIASMTGAGPKLGALTSVPNLALLEHPAQSHDNQINPFYVSQPAPLGLGDFGLGATPYSYNTSHIMGEVTFNTPPNATDPQSTGLLEVQGQHDGYVGSYNEFGIQLNTVATNISIPGSDQGFFWTQNVVNWNATGIHFVSDTFNMTNATQNPYVIAPGTLYSACGYTGNRIEQVLFNYGGVFQCVGGTVPLTAASYPVTIQLYNNATLSKQDRSEVSYGYRIIMAGTGMVYTGVSDLMVFNSPGAATHTAPANPAGFSIDGFAPSPTGLFRDAEIVLVGGIGGDNSVFTSVNGSINLMYSNASWGGWQNVPSAYNFGGDTGETGTGIADYWTPSHTLEINTGPAMLYGLWNAVPYVSVASGDIELSGTISPDFGFVFVSNTAPVLDPWNATLGERDNMSWLPSSTSGAFNTYLPPLGGAWTSQYYVQAFAPGYAEYNGTTVTGTDLAYAIVMTPSAGPINAPLYADSNAQAAALEMTLTGSMSAPYTFSNLYIDENFTFNHLNDYAYPEFTEVMFQGVTGGVHISAVYEGLGDSGMGNFYFRDFGQVVEGGLLAPAPFTEGPLENYTASINLYYGTDDQVYNMTLYGDGPTIVLWHEVDAQVWGLYAVDGGLGVLVGDSWGTAVWDVIVVDAAGVEDMGSAYTLAYEILVEEYGLGVESYSSFGAEYALIEAAYGSFGVEVGADYGASADYASYYYLPGDTDLTLYEIVAYDDSTGANVSLSTGIHADYIGAWDGSLGVVFANSAWIRVDHVVAKDNSDGVAAVFSSHIGIKDVSARDDSVGVILYIDDWVQVTKVVANDHSIAVAIHDSMHVKLHDIHAHDHSVAVEYY
jgi:hypothetical protein